jgi:four helix bundle protein
VPPSVVPGSDFRDLAAYRIAAELSDELYRVVGRWPPFDQWTMGIQMIRSADSVGANTAEASGRSTVPERRRFLLIARGSLHELEHWMSRAEARGVLEADTARLEELARTVNGLVRRHRQT